MYLVKHALKNLGRNKGRNLLLAIVIFAVIMAATVAIVIHQTADAVIDDYKSRFGSMAEIVMDWDSTTEYFSTSTQTDADGMLIMPSITAEQYLSFADSSYLRDYSINYQTYVALDGATAVGQDDDSQTQNNGGGVLSGDWGMSVITKYSASAKLVADANPSSMDEFQSGARKITDGKLYENENECIISQDFANKNNLKVGDSLMVVEPTQKDTPEKVITLTISGIYADSTTVDEFAKLHTPSNRRNEILISIDTMNASDFSTEMTEVTATYELTSPDVLADFEQELRSKGLPDLYTVSTNESAYNKVVAPVQGLTKITDVFTWVVLAVGAAIILLVASMAVRERKYEMAVLRAMGLKKMKVIAMLMTELIVITAFGLCVGLGLGATTSQPVADALLSQQVELAKEAQTSTNNFIYVDPSTENVEALSEINVSLSPEAMAQICLIALCIAILSTTMGAYYVAKYEPLNLLSERN